MIEAKFILGSIHPISGVRLTTLWLKYPRFIHCEFLTHRMFSRNSSSSRALSSSRTMNKLYDGDYVVPIEWYEDNKSMATGEALSQTNSGRAQDVWMQAMASALGYAEELKDMNVHHSYVNRLLEPFSHIETIVTATEWDNFFELRMSPDAQPEIFALARAMKEAMDKGDYKKRVAHIPFYEESLEMRASAGRCARVSYENFFSEKKSMEDDIKLAERLLENKHMSPFEHVAIASTSGKEMIRNFCGWTQLRVLIEEAMN